MIPNLPGFSDSGHVASSVGPVNQGGLTIGGSMPAWLPWAAVAAVVVVAALLKRKG